MVRPQTDGLSVRSYATDCNEYEFITNFWCQGNAQASARVGPGLAVPLVVDWSLIGVNKE